MTKFEKLYNKVTEILYWAEGQRHINYDQRDLLLDNIIDAKERIEAEEDE